MRPAPSARHSRASHHDGKYPAAHRHHRLHRPNRWNQPEKWSRGKRICFLPLMPTAWHLDEFTIAEALKQGGYATFFAGKWHLGPQGYYPENQGFDVNKGGLEWGQSARRKPLFLSLWQQKAPGRTSAKRRASAGPARRRDGRVHCRPSRSSVFCVPQFLFRPHAADGP